MRKKRREVRGKSGEVRVESGEVRGKRGMAGWVNRVWGKITARGQVTARALLWEKG